MSRRDAFTKRCRATRLVPKGIGHERVEGAYGDRERAFRLAWQDLHDRNHDLLGLLMVPPTGRWQYVMPGWPERLTTRERVVAATVIQWLGSNVGWAFLMRVLRHLGEIGAVEDLMRPALRSWPGPPRLVDRRPARRRSFGRIA